MTALDSIGLALGWSGIALGIGVFLWGIEIDGRQWWRRFWRSLTLMIPYASIRDLALDYGLKFDRYGVNQNVGHDLEGALKNAAANGELTVWGRPYNGPVRDHDPLVPISADHFLEYSFRHGALEWPTDNEETRTATFAMIGAKDEGLKGVTFYDLHVSASEARAVLSEFGRLHSARIMADIGNTLVEIQANAEFERKAQNVARLRRIAEGRE